MKDMKSIIAYSTVSQISYMLLCSLVVISVSVSHIIFHALFKSLLFMLAGEIIHLSHSN
jgi:NADH-quinone oxidoreductase subunit L